MKLCDLVFTECSENVYQHGGMLLIRQFDHLNGRYLWTCTHTEVYIKRKATSSDHVTALRTWVSEAYAIRDASPSAPVRAVLDGFIEPWHEHMQTFVYNLHVMRPMGRWDAADGMLLRIASGWKFCKWTDISPRHTRKLAQRVREIQLAPVHQTVEAALRAPV